MYHPSHPVMLTLVFLLGQFVTLTYFMIFCFVSFNTNLLLLFNCLSFFICFSQLLCATTKKKSSFAMQVSILYPYPCDLVVNFQRFPLEYPQIFFCPFLLTLHQYHMVLSAKQEGIKYPFLSLWYDSILDWNLVSQTIGEDVTHDANESVLIDFVS